MAIASYREKTDEEERAASPLTLTLNTISSS